MPNDTSPAAAGQGREPIQGQVHPALPRASSRAICFGTLPAQLADPRSASLEKRFPVVPQHAEGALRGTAGFSASTLKQGDAANIFVSIPAHSRLPSIAKPGDLLWGEISFGGNIDDLNGAGKKPGGYSLTLTVPAAKNTFPSNKPKPGRRPRKRKPPNPAPKKNYRRKSVT